jgi:hypothetical protein
MLIKIKVPSGKSIVAGEINNKVFSKTVEASKHTLFSKNAWAIDSNLFNTLIRKYATEIVIYDKENDVTYSLPISEFAKKMDYIHFKNSGRQVYVPKNEWKIKNEQNQPTQLEVDENYLKKQKRLTLF